MEELILTDNGKRVLDYMQAHDSIVVGKDLIEIIGIKGIYPVLYSLQKKDLIQESSPVIRDFTNSKGETKPKEYKTYQLTEKGRAFVIA